MKKLIKESGLRNIGDLSKRYQKAKIYFHQDLDGVTTALAMKNYLEDNGIKVVDSEMENSSSPTSASVPVPSAAVFHPLKL